MLSIEAIDRLCHTAVTGDFDNGQELADYVRLMATCGSRRDETLRLKWSDVDWNSKQLTVGTDGQTKNGQSRSVDFNSKLELHLQDMLSRRQPDSVWLFPSPRRGESDRPAKTFVESMRQSRFDPDLPDRKSVV